MVVIRHFRPRRALMLPFLDGLHDLSNLCKAIHTVKVILAVQQHWPQPMLEPRAASGAFDFRSFWRTSGNMLSNGLADINVLCSCASTFTG